MKPQELISLAIRSGCEVIEYDDHFCIRKSLDVNVIVTVPKVAHLVTQLVEKIKNTLGL